jgi:hypothetical protein
MTGETAGLGEVDPRDDVRGARRRRHRRPHATDLIEAAVVALDSEATIETWRTEWPRIRRCRKGLKEAGLVALGRPIHLPPRRK